jgi:crossover junction endonuclease MUS81
MLRVSVGSSRGSSMTMTTSMSGRLIRAESTTKTKSKSRNPIADTLDSDSDRSPSPPPKKARKASTKTYIPARGSGGYGVLLALVLAIDQPELNTQVFLTKGEIIRTAQKYCESSYEHSERGSYFTAWSTVKTLVNKGYVYTTGNPHKYCLTEDG